MKKNSVIIDVQFGDTGKGRVANHFSKNYDWVCRTSGANNCGHTIYRDGKKYVHNLIPSFDWTKPNTRAFMGSNMVIDLDHLVKEAQTLYNESPDALSRLYLDPDAFSILPEHISIDREKNRHLGTTNRGVGPAYAQKIARSGVKISKFIQDNDERIVKLKTLGLKFKYVLELEEDFRKNSILFESSQGIMIDIDHGTYPFVSSGSASLAGIHSSGFSFVKIDEVFGITKAYLTKVGAGPLPTKSNDAVAQKIGNVGQEIGATTGRKRDVAYIDLPALKYACTKGGITSIILTKADVLNGIDKIPVCTSYKGIDKVVSPSQLFDAIPEYTHMNGWSNCSADANYMDAMALYEFIKSIEEYVGVKVSHISTGVSEKDLRVWR